MSNIDYSFVACYSAIRLVLRIYSSSSSSLRVLMSLFFCYSWLESTDKRMSSTLVSYYKRGDESSLFKFMQLATDFLILVAVWGSFISPSIPLGEVIAVFVRLLIEFIFSRRIPLNRWWCSSQIDLRGLNWEDLKYWFGECPLRLK